MAKKFLALSQPNGDYHTAYLELADHPHELVAGCVKRTVRVHNFIENYNGPGIAIDFDAQGRAIGIEILYPHLKRRRRCRLRNADLKPEFDWTDLSWDRLLAL